MSLADEQGFGMRDYCFSWKTCTPQNNQNICMTFYRNQFKLSFSLDVNSGDNSWESGDIGDNDGPGCSGRDDGDQTTNEMMVTKPPMRRW